MEEKQVSQRIKTLVDQIKYPRLADVGTDHGYIPIWACKQGKVTHAIGMDIAKLPLENARRNVMGHHLQGQITLRLGDGIRPLKAGEADVIIIAGMGGKTIREILTDQEQVLEGVSQLILSPQSGVPNVRRHVHGLGYLIETEIFILEDGRYYHILNCVKGQETYTALEYELGKCLMEKPTPIYLAYLSKEKQKLAAILAQIDPSLDRAKELKAQIAYYKNLV